MNLHMNPVEVQRAKYLRNQTGSRSSLLLAVVMTALTLFLMRVAGYFFYFSAMLPILISDFGYAIRMVTGGEFTAEEMGMDKATFDAMSGLNGEMIDTVCLVIAIVIVLAYFLCWLLSKKHVAWLYVALTMYAVDTLIALPIALDSLTSGAVVDGIFILGFHAWIIYDLIKGIVAWHKLSKMPAPILEGEATELPHDPMEETVSASSADSQSDEG